MLLFGCFVVESPLRLRLTRVSNTRYREVGQTFQLVCGCRNQDLVDCVQARLTTTLAQPPPIAC